MGPGEKEQFVKGESVTEFKVATLDNLRKTLDTPAWSDLKKDESEITRVFTHDLFLDGPSGSIDIEKLITFGIFHCAGDVKAKTTALYGVFQYGGSDRQEFLAANDKDITPVIENMMKFVTVDVARLMKDVQGNHPMDLDDKDKDVEELVEEL